MLKSITGMNGFDNFLRKPHKRLYQCLWLEIAKGTVIQNKNETPLFISMQIIVEK